LYLTILYFYFRESCIIALDMYDYANSEEFQYANSLTLAA
jgi:hypothetical protein